MGEYESMRLKTAIKSQLALRKAKYRDLAVHLACSIPTVKRILGDEELSVSRLLQILAFLDLSLSELEMLAARQDEKNAMKFTRAQEEFLVQNPNCFAYLTQLYGGETPATIATKYKLTPRASDKYLLALERADLIHVTGSGKVKPALNPMPKLGDGPLAKAHFRAFMERSTRFFINVVAKRIYALEKKAGEFGEFSVQSAKCSVELYKRYQADQERQLQEFSRAAAYEEKTRPPDELRTAVVLSAIAYVANDDKELEKFESVFGQIT